MLSKLWLRITAFFRLLFIRYLAWRMQSNPDLQKEVLETPAKRALRRITLEGLCPPDTVSMGVMNGGPAVYFTHDLAKEVFIGNTYEHAADRFIEWMRDQKAMGEGYAPTTKKTTKLNRHERRAYESKKFRNKHKG